MFYSALGSPLTDLLKWRLVGVIRDSRRYVKTSSYLADLTSLRLVGSVGAGNDRT